jgi:hypothetical protein
VNSGQKPCICGPRVRPRQGRERARIRAQRPTCRPPIAGCECRYELVESTIFSILQDSPRRAPSGPLIPASGDSERSLRDTRTRRRGAEERVGRAEPAPGAGSGSVTRQSQARGASCAARMKAAEIDGAKRGDVAGERIGPERRVVRSTAAGLHSQPPLRSRNRTRRRLTITIGVGAVELGARRQARPPDVDETETPQSIRACFRPQGKRRGSAIQGETSG